MEKIPLADFGFCFRIPFTFILTLHQTQQDPIGPCYSCSDWPALHASQSSLWIGHLTCNCQLCLHQSGKPLKRYINFTVFSIEYLASANTSLSKPLPSPYRSGKTSDQRTQQIGDGKIGTEISQCHSRMKNSF